MLNSDETIINNVSDKSENFNIKSVNKDKIENKSSFITGNESFYLSRGKTKFFEK